MQRADVVEGLRRFIATELVDDPAAELDATTPLLAWGIVDSMSVVSLLTFIETSFGVVVPAAQVRPDNLETIDRLADLVLRLGAETAEGVV